MKKSYGLLVAITIICFLYIMPASALSISVHVPEKYTEVNAGERLYFEIEVKYPENPSRKDLKLSYEVIDSEGNLIAQAKVLKAIETQASFIDFIIVPENAKSGLHIIKVNVEDYENLRESVESSFHVSSGGFNQIKLYFFVLLGAVILVGILVLVSIFEKKK